jgi:hypothetical protein
MNLKNEVDNSLRRIYFLTETIKKLVPLHDYTKNVRTNQVIIEILQEYKRVSKTTMGLLEKYIQQERSRGIAPLEYIRTYRKLGEKDEHQSKNSR